MHCGRPDRRGWRPLLLASLLGAGGCASLADRIAAPDPGERAPTRELLAMESGMGIERRSARLDTGVVLSWREVPAAERGFWIETTPTDGGGLAFEMGTRKGRQDANPVAHRGSIVYLHGWQGEAAAMLPWALAFAEHGYTGIAIDLRGHGASGDAPPGYGPAEARDVAELVSTLVTDGSIASPVYLFGVSYGATTALFAGPLLRDRIAGVIALEPFANAAEGIRGGVRGWSRLADKSLRGKLANWAMRNQTAPEGVERAIDEASMRLGIDLRSVDAGEAVEEAATCMLLVHGTKDRWLSPDATRRMAERSAMARFVPVEGANHLTLPLRIDLLETPIAEWMQATAAGQCPPATVRAD